MRAMILAAGRGERMRPLTDTTHKVFLPVQGEPLIVHHLKRLSQAGIKDVVINLAYKGEQIRQALGDGHAFGVRITYSPEPEGGLETAGGVIQALPLLGSGPFLLLSGDIWTDYPFEACLVQKPEWAHLVMVPNPDFHPHGDFYLRGKSLCHEGKQSLTYANIGVYNSHFFEGLEPQFLALGPLLNQAIRQKKLTGECFNGIWENVGTPEQWSRLQTPA